MVIGYELGMQPILLFGIALLRRFFSLSDNPAGDDALCIQELNHVQNQGCGDRYGRQVALQRLRLRP